MKEEYRQILDKRKDVERGLLGKCVGDNFGLKRRKLKNGSDYIELPVRYEK